jgi:hypothetical protein
MLAGLIACGKKEASIKQYYFPYATFTEPKVYQYADSKDSNLVMYWHFKTDIENSDTILTTSFYDQNYTLTNVFINKITNEGARLIKMYINMGDSSKMYPCEVKKDEVYNWSIKPKQTIFVSYNLYSPDSTQSKEIVTERSFENNRVPLNFNGKQYQCLLVKEQTIINHITVNRTKTEEQERSSYFAEGIGLIQLETFHANGSSNVFILQKILTKGEWKGIQPMAVDSNSTKKDSIN